MQCNAFVFVFGVIFVHSLRYMITCLSFDGYGGDTYSLHNTLPLFVYNTTNQTRTIMSSY